MTLSLSMYEKKFGAYKLNNLLAMKKRDQGIYCSFTKKSTSDIRI